MAHDPSKTGSPEGLRIDAGQERELSYWSEKLGVSRDKLRDAVQAVGPMVKDVQRYLGHPVRPHPPLEAPGRRD